METPGKIPGKIPSEGEVLGHQAPAGRCTCDSNATREVELVDLHTGEDREITGDTTPFKIEHADVVEGKAPNESR